MIYEETNDRKHLDVGHYSQGPEQAHRTQSRRGVMIPNTSRMILLQH